MYSPGTYRKKRAAPLIAHLLNTNQLKASVFLQVLVFSKKVVYRLVQQPVALLMNYLHFKAVEIPRSSV